MSCSATDLIRHLLTTDAEARLTAAQALEHPWIKDADKAKKGTLTLTRKNLAKHVGGRVKVTPSHPLSTFFCPLALGKLFSEASEGGMSLPLGACPTRGGECYIVNGIARTVRNEDPPATALLPRLSVAGGTNIALLRLPHCQCTCEACRCLTSAQNRIKSD